MMNAGEAASRNGTAGAQADVRAMGERVDVLLKELAAAPNPIRAREKSEELVAVLVQMYGAGLARVLELVDEAAGEASPRIFERLAEDDFVSHLLILHGLHPRSVEERIEAALDRVRVYLHSHEGDVKLLRIEGDVAYLKMAGSCHGCPSSAQTMTMAIERAVMEAAPEIAAIRAEGVHDGAPPQRKASEWVSLDELPELAQRGVAMVEVEGTPVLFLRSDESLYAYRNQCPRCLHGLSRATIDWPTLTCASCGGQYDVVKAGRAVGGDGQIEPFPLVRQGERVQLAVPVSEAAAV